MYEEYESNRNFTKLHQVLLKIDSKYTSISDYLISLETEKSTIINMPDAFGKTPFAWAVEYGFTASTELLLKFGANPNHFRVVKDGSFSPLIHIAIAGPRSTWMDDDIVEIVRLLFAAGADINGINHESWTALHIATSWNLFKITDMLYQCGRQCLVWDTRTLQGGNIFDIMDYQIKYSGMLNNPMCLI